MGSTDNVHFDISLFRDALCEANPNAETSSRLDAPARRLPSGARAGSYAVPQAWRSGSPIGPVQTVVLWVLGCLVTCNIGHRCGDQSDPAPPADHLGQARPLIDTDDDIPDRPPESSHSSQPTLQSTPTRLFGCALLLLPTSLRPFTLITPHARPRPCHNHPPCCRPLISPSLLTDRALQEKESPRERERKSCRLPSHPFHQPFLAKRANPLGISLSHQALRFIIVRTRPGPQVKAGLLRASRANLAWPRHHKQEAHFAWRHSLECVSVAAPPGCLQFWQRRYRP